jgi:hypothetical protein
MTALARTSSSCKWRTHSLVREEVTWGLWSQLFSWKSTDLEPQEACRQDKLIGGKPWVVTFGPCSSLNISDHVSRPCKKYRQNSNSCVLIFSFLENRRKDEKFWTKYRKEETDRNVAVLCTIYLYTFAYQMTKPLLGRLVAVSTLHCVWRSSMQNSLIFFLHILIVHYSLYFFLASYFSSSFILSNASPQPTSFPFFLHFIHHFAAPPFPFFTSFIIYFLLVLFFVYIISSYYFSYFLFSAFSYPILSSSLFWSALSRPSCSTAPNGWVWRETNNALTRPVVSSLSECDICVCICIMDSRRSATHHFSVSIQNWSWLEA